MKVPKTTGLTFSIYDRLVTKLRADQVSLSNNKKVSIIWNEYFLEEKIGTSQINQFQAVFILRTSAW
jgi:hypothetical protein